MYNIHYNKVRSLERLRQIKRSRSIQRRATIIKCKIYRGLQKTLIGMALGKQLEVINRGINRDFRLQIRVLRYFSFILRNQSAIAFGTGLRGIKLTFAEKKLLIRINLKKQEFYNNLHHHLNGLKKIRKSNERFSINRHFRAHNTINNPHIKDGFNLSYRNAHNHHYHSDMHIKKNEKGNYHTEKYLNTKGRAKTM